MADDPKIIPDSPPSLPFDVQITPDGPPWQPHDVPVYPDAATWDPVDVPLYPDMPPLDAFQVATPLDGPPWTAHDVPTYPDKAPWDPVDVPTTLDPAPWAPVDVNVVPDAPPAAPFDVQVSPDQAPWAPVDVNIIMPPPPFAAFDVPITPDHPPASPVDVATHYRDHRVPEPTEPVPVHTRVLVDRVRKYDHQLANFLDKVGDFVPFVSAAGKGALDPLVLANWLRNYKDAVGYNGMLKFIEEQTVLYAMNPVVARFFDPTYFIKMAIPGSTGMFNTHIDTGFSDATTIALAKDEMIPATPEHSWHRAQREEQNVFDEGHKSTDVQDFSVDSMVDDLMSEVPKTPQYMKVDPSVGVARFDAGQYFETYDKFKTGAQAIRGTTKGRVITGQGPHVANSKLAKSAATHGILRIPVPGDGVPRQGGTVAYDGVVLSDTPVPPVDDDDVRLPLCFTDLRKDPSSDSFRHVYFQPMNLVINTSFSPNYNETQSFGRVDPTVGYVGTSRSWSVSFEQHAFAPEDLRVMYEKMTWLISMVYPTYGDDALMRSGPVCRMRVGDVAATSQGGIPGVIKGLNFDFAECLWELKRGMKVPRSFSVQLDYQVLHDGPVGLLNGMFGVLSLPSGPSTNMAGRGPVAPSQETNDTSTSETVSMARGHWAKFGEPTRKG